MERVAPKDELDTCWTITDMLKANALLDMRLALERESYKVQATSYEERER